MSAAVEALLAGLAGIYDPGEDVDELDHAMQCATLAYESGAGPELVAAALVHDIGRHPELERPRFAHERTGALWALSACTVRHAERVAWLVGAHVAAKIWLAGHEAGYPLSEVSRASLLVQSSGEGSVLASYVGHVWWADALRLRRWDDAAKVPGASVASLREIMAVSDGLWA
ncbi:MAG TPA: hypothetical protein VFN61_01075 [Acidimicrobiales bacterium]|nr:hypothetical protein [Acidimicrobiales bacterium]